METFDYAAIDKSGKRLTGSLAAISGREARDQLRGKGFTPVSITPAKTKAATGNAGGKKVPHKDLTQAGRQLAILIEAATPIEQALKIVALQFEKSPMRGVLLDVRAKVLEGAKLSEALRAHPKTFDALYVALIASGESSGRLAAVMDRLATDMEAAQKIRRKIIGATVYPMVLSVVALVVVVILMVGVVPKVVAQFETFGQDLPPLTVAVIAVSAWLKAYGLIAAAVIIAAGVGIKLALHNPNLRLKKDAIMLRLPLLGRVTRDLNAARFARTIAGLIDSGTPSLQAMETARHTLKNSVMNAAVTAAAVRVREGQALSESLRRTGVFPPLVTQMVAGGEASGDIGKMFSKSADYLESEFDSATTIFLSLLEPLIIIILSIIVLLIIAAIFLPILRLNTMAF